MKSHKVLKILSLLIISCGLFSCGTVTVSIGGNSSSASTASSQTSSTPITDVSFHFWHTFSKLTLAELTSTTEKFQKLVKENDGVNLTISLDPKGGYDEMTDFVTKSFAAGNTPTLAIAYPDHVATYLSKEKTDGEFVVNMESLAKDSEIGFGKESWIGDADSSDFISKFYEEGTQYAKTGLYSLPFMKSSEIMFYNKDLVLKAMKYYDDTVNTFSKVDALMKNISWDNLMVLCKDIKDHMSELSNTLEVPAFYDSDANLFITQCMQQNIPYVSLDADGKGKLDFVNDEAKAMVTKLKGYYDQGLFTTKGIENVYGSTPFVELKTVFSMGSSGGAGYQIPNADTFTVGVCKIPSSNVSNSVYVSQGPTITMLKNPGVSDEENNIRVKYAWKYLKYLTSSQVDADMCENGSAGYIPVRASSYETDSFSEYMNDETSISSESLRVVHNDIGGSYFNTPAFPGSTVAREKVGGIISTVLKGSKSVDQAFKDAYDATMAMM